MLRTISPLLVPWLPMSRFFFSLTPLGNLIPKLCEFSNLMNHALLAELNLSTASKQLKPNKDLSQVLAFKHKLNEFRSALLRFLMTHVQVSAFTFCFWFS